MPEPAARVRARRPLAVSYRAGQALLVRPAEDRRKGASEGHPAGARRRTTQARERDHRPRAVAQAAPHRTGAAAAGAAAGRERRGLAEAGCELRATLRGGARRPVRRRKLQPRMRRRMTPAMTQYQGSRGWAVLAAARSSCSQAIIKAQATDKTMGPRNRPLIP